MNMKKIYRKIAKEYGVSVSEVKRDMQFAIQDAYKNNSHIEKISSYQNQVPRKDDLPNTEEILEFMAQKVRRGI